MARCAPASLVLTLYDELAEVPPFDEDLEGSSGGGPAAVRRLRDRVRSADGVLIATPEYNWSIPGVLKNALDWLSRPAPDEVLVAKPVAVVGATGGAWGTRLAQATLRQVLTATESAVLPSPTLFVRDANRLWGSSGDLTDPPTIERLRALLEAFSNWIDVCAAKRTVA